MFIQEVAENRNQPVPGGYCRLTRCPHMEQLATFSSFGLKIVWVRNPFGGQPGSSPAPGNTGGLAWRPSADSRAGPRGFIRSLAPPCVTGGLGSGGLPPSPPFQWGARRAARLMHGRGFPECPSRSAGQEGCKTSSDLDLGVTWHRFRRAVLVKQAVGSRFKRRGFDSTSLWGRDYLERTLWLRMFPWLAGSQPIRMVFYHLHPTVPMTSTIVTFIPMTAISVFIFFTPPSPSTQPPPPSSPPASPLYRLHSIITLQTCARASLRLRPLRSPWNRRRNPGTEHFAHADPVEGSPHEIHAFQAPKVMEGEKKAAPQDAGGSASPPPTRAACEASSPVYPELPPRSAHTASPQTCGGSSVTPRLESGQPERREAQSPAPNILSPLPQLPKLRKWAEVGMLSRHWRFCLH